MSDRSDLKHRFLAAQGLAEAPLRILAGDASNRRYDRIDTPNGPLVLMDAPPEKGEDVRPFVALATFLKDQGLSPPSILAQDEVNGFLLLEDLGDALFARVVEDQPAMEQPLYLAATDALIALHKTPAPTNLPVFGPAQMAELSALSLDWYAPVFGPVSTGARAQMVTIMQSALSDVPGAFDVTVLRDFHAENLLWLGDRTGPARVGLLDFQDAGLGHPAYDIVSLLDDVRRDVQSSTKDAVMRHYSSQMGLDPGAFEHAAAVCSAQRLLRIIGVFARLNLRDAKPGYLAYLPRTFALLERCLNHPALTELRDLVRETLPDPTPEQLERLRAS